MSTKNVVIIITLTFLSQLCFAQPSIMVRKQPPIRQHPAMAYDEANQQVVLYGGWSNYEGDPGLNDTWLWNGTEWKQKFVEGPGKIWNHSMAYDSNRNRVVLHGGYWRAPDGTGVTSFETWEWDGQQWHKMTSEGPHPAPMVYDKARQETILFDGSMSDDISETYSWDGTNWTLVAQGGPLPVDQHAMAYDEANQEILLFGGATADYIVSGTWIWDGQNWQEKLIESPGAPLQHSMAYDSIRKFIVKFGGYYYNNLTWLWDAETWSSVEGKVPGHGSYSSMVFDKARGEAVLFGGTGWAENEPFKSKDYGTWVFDGETWQLKSPIPNNNFFYDVVYDESHQNVLLFGGNIHYPNFEYGSVQKTYSWDGITWKIYNLDIQPPEREGHKMAYDPINKGVWLFGGGDAALNDLWFWNGTSWAEIDQNNTPPARSGHAMAYDANRDKLVLFGGYTGDYSIVDYFPISPNQQQSVFLNDTWEWDGNDWTLVSNDGPAPRRFSKLVYHPTLRKVLLFGGDQLAGYAEGPEREFQEVWSWDGQTWEQIETQNYPLMAGSNVFYVPSRDSIIVTGKPVDPSVSPIWELKDNQWYPMQSPKNYQYVQNGMAYDTKRQTFVLYKTFSAWELNLEDLISNSSNVSYWSNIH